MKNPAACSDGVMTCFCLSRFQVFQRSQWPSECRAANHLLELIQEGVYLFLSCKFFLPTFFLSSQLISQFCVFVRVVTLYGRQCKGTHISTYCIDTTKVSKGPSSLLSILQLASQLATSQQRATLVATTLYQQQLEQSNRAMHTALHIIQRHHHRGKLINSQCTI